MDQLDQRPQIDFLLIADRAEVVSGKLYMMGGAWEQISVANPAQPIGFSIALGILIPWNATNERHRLRLAVEDADGGGLAELDGEIVAGRPPHLPSGSQQRLLFATTIGVLIPRGGRYAVIASLNGAEARRTPFDVTLAPPPA